MIAFGNKILKNNNINHLTDLIDEKILGLLKNGNFVLGEITDSVSDWIENNENLEESQRAKVRKDLANVKDAYAQHEKVRDDERAEQEAAQWLETKLELLKKIGGEAALKKNSDLIEPSGLARSPEQVEQFYQDIYKYLAWIRYYLSKGEDPRSLYEGAIAPTLPISIYIDAFRFIVEQAIPEILAEESEKLSPKGCERLNFYLSDCLIKGLEKLADA